MPIPSSMQKSQQRSMQKSTPRPDIFFKNDEPVVIRLLYPLDEVSIGTTVLNSRAVQGEGFHMHTEFKGDPTGATNGEFIMKPCWYEYERKSCPSCAGHNGKRMQDAKEYYSTALLKVNPEYNPEDANSRYGYQLLLLQQFTQTSLYPALFDWIDKHPQIDITEVELLVTQRKGENGRFYEIEEREAYPLPDGYKPFTLDQMRRMIARKYEPALLFESEEDKAAKEADRQKILENFRKNRKPQPTGEPVRPTPVVPNQLAGIQEELNDDLAFAQRQQQGRPGGVNRGFTKSA